MAAKTNSNLTTIQAQARAARHFSSKDAVIPCHIPTVIICGGDYNSAALLEQILYWSSRTANKDGWIAKTYEDWGRELWKSANTVRDTVKRLEQKSLIETRVFRSPFYNHRAVQHVRIDTDGYAEALDVALSTIEAQSGEGPNPIRPTESVVLKEGRNPSSYVTETTAETTERETPSLELPDHLTPAQRRMIEFPTTETQQPNGDGGALAYTLIEAYCDAWGVFEERYRNQWHRTHAKGAASLAALGATPDEITAMVAERRAKNKQPDECPMTFLASDYVGWKSRQFAAPAARVLSDSERAAQEAALEAERVAWRKAQGLS